MQAYMSLTQIQLQMKSGGIVQGKLEISRDNYLEGLLRDGDKEILIQGRNDLNRAMNEDIVAVRIKAKNEWKAPSSRCLDSELQPGADEAEALINRGRIELKIILQVLYKVNTIQVKLK